MTTARDAARTSVHEASHAAIAMAFRCKVLSATLEPQLDGALGAVSYKPSRRGFRNAVIALAGIEAERLFFGIADPNLADRESARAALGTWDAAALDEAFSTARALVEQHRPAIERVAEALIARRTLDARDLAELVAP